MKEMSKENEFLEKLHTAEQASERATTWCEMHPGWQKICDIQDSDLLYKTWEELPQHTRRGWEREYRRDAKDAWLEFGDAPCKVPFGFISGAGKFYKKIVDVPVFHNSMMVFKTS